MIFVVLWATGFVVARLSAGHVAPVWFLALRFPLAALFMLGLALAQRARWPDAKGALHASVAGALLHALYLAPIYWAVANGLPGGVSALFVGLQPFFTAFIAAAMVGERVTKWHWLGIFVGITGVALVLAPKLTFTLLGGITPLTAGLCVFAVLAAALGSVYQKKYAGTVPLSSGGFWQYVGASFVVLVISVALGDYQFDSSPQAWIALGWAVLVLSIVAILLLMVMIREGEVSRVSGWLFLEPGLAALMTYVLFNETLSPVQLLGMAVCAGSVLLINGPSAKQSAAR